MRRMRHQFFKKWIEASLHCCGTLCRLLFNCMLNGFTTQMQCDHLIIKLIKRKTSLVVLYSQNYATGIRRRCHESSGCFECPKICPLKSIHPKKYLPNFPSQKYLGIGNFRLKKMLPSFPSLKSGELLSPRNTSFSITLQSLIYLLNSTYYETENPSFWLCHWRFAILRLQTHVLSYWGG